MTSKVYQYEACVIQPLFQDKGGYSQESQQLPIKFVPLWKSDNSAQIFYQSNSPFLCRDFIGDLICSLRWKKKFDIYGFTSDYNKIKEITGASYLSLKLIFPTQQNKKNFKKNITQLLLLFKLRNTANRLYISDYLNEKDHSYVVSCDSLTNPLIGSLTTFLFKIAAMDLKDCNWRSPKEFIESIQSIYPGQKDVSYFSRVNIEVFDHLYAVESYCNSIVCMNYLQKYKDNVVFLHNNSGFFSQFSKYANIATSYARRFVGHILETTGVKCFEFQPMSKEELQEFYKGRCPFTSQEFHIIYEEGQFSLVKKAKKMEEFIYYTSNGEEVSLNIIGAATAPPVPQWLDDDVEDDGVEITEEEAPEQEEAW